MLKIGLTGGIGSGKSSVSRWFKDKGVQVLDADRIAHEILASDKTVIGQIAKHFGPHVINEVGQVHRRELGKIVFADSEARARLEGIIHPAIISKLTNLSDELESRGIPIVIWDVPLLFETGLYRAVDEVWVVWTEPRTQFERLMIRDALPEEEIKNRINAQMPLAEKVSRADIVIDNSSTWEQTEQQLKREWERIREEYNGDNATQKNE